MPDRVSDRLKEAIAHSGMSMKEFAEKCGLPYRTLQNYVSGEREPGANSLERIVTQMGISIDWLLTGEGTIERKISDNRVPFTNKDVLKRILLRFMRRVEEWDIDMDEEQLVDLAFITYEQLMKSKEGEVVVPDTVDKLLETFKR